MSKIKFSHLLLFIPKYNSIVYSLPVYCVLSNLDAGLTLGSCDSVAWSKNDLLKNIPKKHFLLFTNNNLT